MAIESKIQWTKATFNPWRGCVKVSPGCEHCYAEDWAERSGKDIWGPNAAREFASERYWKEPVKWNAAAAASGEFFPVFCASLADVCEDRPDLVPSRERLMRLIEDTPALTWLLTTKRPENFNRLFGALWGKQWPQNVVAMTTCEDQARADKRLPELVKVPAYTLAVSYEPALGPVDFRRWLVCVNCADEQGPFKDAPRPITEGTVRGCLNPRVNWVICGGESGSHARVFDLQWARDVRDQVQSAGAAFFMKQLGAKRAWSRLDDGLLIRDPKGGDPAEWPEDIRIRDFPSRIYKTPQETK